MAWRKVAPAVYERPIGENETFIRMVGEPSISMGREHWAITATAELNFKGLLGARGPAIDHILREAWKRLRYLQPSIAARLVNDKVVYEIPDAASLESWCTGTFIFEPEETTVNDVISHRKPSQWAVLHWLPTISELVLQTSHWRTDGIGVLHIFDVYLDLVCQVAADTADSVIWGTEPTRLAPAIEEAASVSHEQKPELIAIAEKCVSTFALVQGQVGIKYHGRPNLPPSGTRTRRLQFSEAETISIATAARSHNISVTSALHASVAAANYAFANEADRSKPFTSTIRFGLRPYIPEPYNAREYGSALYTSGYMFQVPSSQSWAQNATEFNREYRKGYSSIMPAHRQYARLLNDAIRNMPPPSGPPDINIDISSLGVVDSVISPVHKSADAEIEVTSVSVGTEMVTRQITCFVWTFRGALNAHMVYNEAYHIGEEVERILQFIRQTTLKELGIEG